MRIRNKLWPTITTPKWLPTDGRHIKLMISGALSAGKDHVADALGGTVYRLSNVVRTLHCAADALKDHTFGRVWYQYIGELITHAGQQDFAEPLWCLTQDWYAQIRRAATNVTDRTLELLPEDARMIFCALAWSAFGTPEFFAACAEEWYRQYVSGFKPRALYIVTGVRREAELQYLLRHGYRWVIVITDRHKHYERLERQYGPDKTAVLRHVTEQWVHGVLASGRKVEYSYVVWNGDNGAPDGMVTVDQLKQLLSKE